MKKSNTTPADTAMPVSSFDTAEASLLMICQLESPESLPIPIVFANAEGWAFSVALFALSPLNNRIELKYVSTENLEWKKKPPILAALPRKAAMFVD
jgi:hypothetical protein